MVILCGVPDQFDRLFDYLFSAASYFAIVPFVCSFVMVTPNALRLLTVEAFPLLNPFVGTF